MWKSIKRKRGLVGFGLFLFLCAFAACGKKHAEPNIPLQELIVEYPLDNMLAYAAAEDGTVYAVNLVQMEGEESEYRLHHFDGQGQHKGDIGLGENFSMVETLAVSEDGKQVYFTSQNVLYGTDLYLFSCSVEDGRIDMLCEMPYFDHVKQLAVVGDAVYLLGQSPNWQTKKAPDSGYVFSGERLVAYLSDTGEQIQLGFDFPVSMSASGAETLMVFGYLDGDGYCMMEYDPAKDSMQVVSRLENYKFDRFAACNGGKDVIYDYGPNSRGLVISDVRELSVEAELYPDSMTILMPPGCIGGRVYCHSRETGSLISFPLDAVRQNGRELAFLSKEYGTINAPYGCGYSINRLELSEEKFTLKVLARDKDYDLCMGDTLFGSGGNLRENGVFYPLNDVPEIEEYLDRCFPYVREAATKEDGTIWMLPVNVNIYGMLLRQNAAEKAGLSLYDGMTWEEYAREIQKASEEDRKRIDADSDFLVSVFGEQYFTRYHTLEGGLFPDTYAALYGVCEADCGGSVSQDDFILMSMGGPLWLNLKGSSGTQRYGGDAAYIAMPKLNAEDRNIANCVFLAINPDSSRRDEALNYIASLAAYLSQRRDLPFFRDWQGEGMLDETVHRTYENGEIGFSVDYDVYGEGFDELFSGTLTLSEYMEQTEPKLRTYWGE